MSTATQTKTTLVQRIRGLLLEAPVTFALGLFWVLIFVVMTLAQYRGVPLNLQFLYGGFISTNTSHAFGDLTSRELYAGEVWRILTATFVHFNLLHLLLNLVGLIQLGRMVESWYGSAQFLAIYVLLAVGGNFGAAAARPLLDSGPIALAIHSGGGSTVVLGLIGLVAVVGWRASEEFEGRVWIWMVAILLLNALIGQLWPNIDNLGHAAGAIVGGIVGLVDRTLIQRKPTAFARIAGAVAAIIIAFSFGTAIRHHRAEVAAAREVVRQQQFAQTLARVEIGYIQLLALGLNPQLRFQPKPPNPLELPSLLLPVDPRVRERVRDEMRSTLRELARQAPPFDDQTTLDAFQQVRVLASRALSKPPTPTELFELRDRLQPVVAQSRRHQLAAEQRWVQLRSPEPKYLALLKRPPTKRPPPPARSPATPPAGAEAAPNDAEVSAQTPAAPEPVQESP